MPHKGFIIFWIVGLLLIAVLWFYEASRYQDNRSGVSSYQQTESRWKSEPQ